MPSLRNKPMPALPDAQQIEILGREIAALEPRLRGSMIARTVRRCRARLDASIAHPGKREATLRVLIREIRLSIERQAPEAQIGPLAGA
jgi:hypothetical protein